MRVNHRGRLPLFAAVIATVGSMSVSRAAVIFSEDFESGVGSWTNTGGTGSVTPVTGTPATAPPDAPSSTKSFVVTDETFSRISRAFTANAAATKFRLTFYMRTNTAATSTQRYYGMLSAGTASAPSTSQFGRIGGNNNASYQFVFSNGTTTTTTTNTALAAGWHKVIIDWTPGAAGSTAYGWQIDSNAAQTQVASGANAVVTPTVVSFGQTATNGLVGGADDVTAYFDSVKLEQFATAAAAPASSTPVNSDTNVDPNQDLFWSAAASATQYKVFLGTSPGSLGLVATQAGTTFDPGTLLENTQYFWRVDSLNVLGDATTGTPWSFTTGSVPEPTGLAALSLAGLLLRRRRQ